MFQIGSLKLYDWVGLKIRRNNMINIFRKGVNINLAPFFVKACFIKTYQMVGK